MAEKEKMSQGLRLILAAEEGDAQGVQSALAQGAVPEMNEFGALRWAPRHGHVECVELLIPVSDPLAGSSVALRLAAAHGHGRCVELLLPVSDPLARGSESSNDAAAEARSRGHGDLALMIEAFIEAKALGMAAGGGERQKLRASL